MGTPYSGIARDEVGSGIARDDVGSGIARDDVGSGIVRDDIGCGIARDDARDRRLDRFGAQAPVHGDVGILRSPR